MKINIEEIRLVTWDVDGTLYSLHKMKWYVVLQYLQVIANGGRRVAQEDFRFLRRYRQMIENARTGGGVLAADFPEQLERSAVAAAAHRWYVQVIEKCGPHANLESVLKMLKSRGIRQVAFSDYEAETKLKALKLSEYFDGVYDGVRFGFVKPHPAVLKTIAGDFAIPIESLLHIGDRVDTDEAVSQAAGCRSLIIKRDFKDYASLLRRWTSPRSGNRVAGT
jgi:HAD superfamily hydrolase (TIGR01549 family)